jgi:hypothetical protein
VEVASLKDATKKGNEPETESNRAPRHAISNSKPSENERYQTDPRILPALIVQLKLWEQTFESQGSGNLTTASRDKYFLKKCTEQAWFVVELCEVIKSLKFQIANFELYSFFHRTSLFRISIGNVFPGLDKDWMEFGTRWSCSSDIL